MPFLAALIPLLSNLFIGITVFISAPWIAAKLQGEGDDNPAPVPSLPDSNVTTGGANTSAGGFTPLGTSPGCQRYVKQQVLDLLRPEAGKDPRVQAAIESVQGAMDMGLSPFIEACPGEPPVYGVS